MVNERFRSFVVGVFLAIAMGWVLHIGQDIFIPIIFSVLVGFVIIGLTRLLEKTPLEGRHMSVQIRYLAASLMIVACLFGVVYLLLSNIGRAVLLAPQYQDSLLSNIQGLAVSLGIESEPTWQSLRQQFVAQVSIQKVGGGLADGGA